MPVPSAVESAVFETHIPDNSGFSRFSAAPVPETLRVFPFRKVFAKLFPPPDWESVWRYPRRRANIPQANPAFIAQTPGQADKSRWKNCGRRGGLNCLGAGGWAYCLSRIMTRAWQTPGRADAPDCPFPPQTVFPKMPAVRGRAAGLLWAVPECPCIGGLLFSKHGFPVFNQNFRGRTDGLVPTACLKRMDEPGIFARTAPRFEEYPRDTYGRMGEPHQCRNLLLWRREYTQARG